MHHNNFGILRLVLASLVIISHSFELIDGNRIREPLTRIFGTLSVAELAVAGFFIVSGYLVTQSYVGSRSNLSYISKRLLRIYPAFIAASLFCILLVGPLAGANLAGLSITDWVRILIRMVTLQIPKLSNIFEGQPYPSLNGSMWTIAYEFRCYLVVMLLGTIGLIRRITIPSLAMLSWIGSVLTTPDWPRPGFEAAFGNLHETLRLTVFFMTGASFFLYRDRIVYRADYAVFAAVALAFSLFTDLTAGAGVAIFGSYLIFWFAFLPSTPRLNAVNSTTDISYGVYLYAWPVQMLAIRYFPAITPPALIVVAAASACALAFLSWMFVEHPALSLKSGHVPSARRPALARRRTVNSGD